jgi:hypothetical protein
MRTDWLKWGLCPVLAAAATVAAPRAAGAIGACVCRDQVRVVPEFARDLPLNARAFVSLLPGADPAQLRITAADGSPVAVTITAAGGAPGNVWVIPDGLLAPGTSYSLHLGAASLKTWETVKQPFPVGRDGLDVTRPAIGGVTFEPDGLRDHCGPVSAAATLTLSYADDLAPGGSSVWALDVSNADGVGDPVRLFPDPAQFPPPDPSAGLYWWTSSIGSGALDGQQDCLGNRRFAGGQPGASYRASLTVWDWSGNSTTVENLSFVLASRPSSGGCALAGAPVASSPAAAAAALAPLLAALSVLRRRRRGAPAARG